MTRGIVYLAWGDPAVAQCLESINSLRSYSDVPVTVIGSAAASVLEDVPGVEHSLSRLRPFGQDGRFYAGRVKPQLFDLSPYDVAIYVDADTTWVRGPELAFQLLEAGPWEVLVTDTGHRSLADDVAGPEEAAWTRGCVRVPWLQYNCSGFLAWRNSPAVARLFKLWEREWKRFKGWDEQLALTRALLRSDVLFLTLPYTWNTRHEKEAFMLYHRFGSKDARQDGV